MSYHDQLCTLLKSLHINSNDAIVNYQKPEYSLKEYIGRKLYDKDIPICTNGLLVYSLDININPPASFKEDFPIKHAGFLISKQKHKRYIIFIGETDNDVKNLYLRTAEKYKNIFTICKSLPFPFYENDWEIKKIPITICNNIEQTDQLEEISNKLIESTNEQEQQQLSIEKSTINQSEKINNKEKISDREQKIEEEQQTEIIKNEWMYLVGITDIKPESFKH